MYPSIFFLFQNVCWRPKTFNCGGCSFEKRIKKFNSNVSFYKNITQLLLIIHNNYCEEVFIVTIFYIRNSSYANSSHGGLWNIQSTKDSDLLYSHMGLIGHYVDFVLEV